MLYYMIELASVLDGGITPLLLKEEKLATFLSNYDKENYKVVNIYGIGQLEQDETKFFKIIEGLEQGKG